MVLEWDVLVWGVHILPVYLVRLCRESEVPVTCAIPNLFKVFSAAQNKLMLLDYCNPLCASPVTLAGASSSPSQTILCLTAAEPRRLAPQMGQRAILGQGAKVASPAARRAATKETIREEAMSKRALTMVTTTTTNTMLVAKVTTKARG